MKNSSNDSRLQVPETKRGPCLFTSGLNLVQSVQNLCCALKLIEDLCFSLSQLGKVSFEISRSGLFDKDLVSPTTWDKLTGFLV